MNTATGDLNQTRQTLLNRLKSWDDQASWREFFNLCWRLLHSIARKSGLSEEETQEAYLQHIASRHLPLSGSQVFVGVPSGPKTTLPKASRRHRTAHTTHPATGTAL